MKTKVESLRCSLKINFRQIGKTKKEQPLKYTEKSVHPKKSHRETINVLSDGYANFSDLNITHYQNLKLYPKNVCNYLLKKMKIKLLQRNPFQQHQTSEIMKNNSNIFYHVIVKYTINLNTCFLFLQKKIQENKSLKLEICYLKDKRTK